MSESPSEPGHYADGRLWADDLAAVIEQTGLQSPVVVAWSYGGLVVSDYLRAYGDAGIAAINLVGAAVILKPPTFEHIGPGFLENAGDASESELATNIEAIQRSCGRAPSRSSTSPSGPRRCAGTWPCHRRCEAR